MSHVLTMLAGSDVVVTVRAPLTHRCPVVDEIDEGHVTIAWRIAGKTYELHSLAEYLRGFKDSALSHEEITDLIRNDLSVVREIDLLSVESSWQTAGLEVSCSIPRQSLLGYPAAFVAQDGQEFLPVPWDAFDVLFIGGTTEWKLSAAVRWLVSQAKSRGRHVHMGRVNSERRWRYADAIGCDSADGTFLTFGPDVNLARVRMWNRHNEQGALWR